MRVAVFVRSSFSGDRALPRMAGRWSSWFTMSRCARKALTPPRGRPPAGTQAPEENLAQPRREQEKAQPGRREAGRPRQAPANVHRSAPSRVGGQPPVRQLLCCRRTALRWLRLWPGYGGQTRAQWCLRPQTVGSDTRGVSAGADEQTSAGPAAHQRLLGLGECREPRRATVGAQSCSSHSGQLPSSHLRCLASGRPPHSHLSPLLLFPASETC